MTSLALAFLLSASDPFPPAWQPGEWGPGLRLMPNALSVDAEGLHFRTTQKSDSYPWDADMVRTLPRPITRAETPLVVLWMTLPPFESWPTGLDSNNAPFYFGFRVTAQDQYVNHGNYWPGIFIGRSGGAPWFATRILSGYDLAIPIPATGPWTLGIGFDEAGIITFYAHAGWVALTSADAIATDTTPYPRQMTSLSQHFLALRQEVGHAGLSADFVLRRVATFAKLPALLPTSNRLTSTGYPGAEYVLQRSENLASWTPETTFTGAFDYPASSGFYRITQ